jgi:hypothetical protein
MSNKIQTREEAEKVCTAWACNDPEQATCESAEDAIEEALEGAEITGTLTLKGYVAMPVHYAPIWGPLECMIETLDEEFSDPDGDGTTPTAAMQEAEKVFIAAVLAEYKNHWLEDVYSEQIDVAAWVLFNRPEWLEEEKGGEAP